MARQRNLSPQPKAFINGLNLCPFCNNKNIIILRIDYIHKCLKDCTPFRSGNLLVTPGPYNSVDYAYNEFLCRNYGQISKSLHPDSLATYNKEHDNFNSLSLNLLVR